MMTCNACGKELSATAKFCPDCGAKVAGSSPETKKPLPLTCEVCGHENVGRDAYCESCGARLPGRTVPETPKTSTSAKQTPGQSPSRNKAGRAGKLEPWHYAVGVLILAVVGLFIYQETQRSPAPSAVQQAPSMQFPQNGTQPPGKELLDAIQRLERTVKENPNDVGSTLLLANALHDAGMHDMSYMPRAIDAYRVYLKSQPSDPNARVDLGICYFELGKTDSTKAAVLFALAVQEMESALKTNPTHQAGAFNLGIVQLYSGNFSESNRWFKKATALNPESELGKRAKTILEQHSQQM